METYINLGTRFILNKKDRTLTDTEDGVIYTEAEEIDQLLEKIKNDKEFNRNMEKAIRDTWGLKTELELYQKNWKKNSWFIKVYRTELREYLKKVKLSSNAGLILFYFQPYVEYKTNRIAKPSGESFSNQDIYKLTGLGKDATSKALNELEDKLFIARVGQRQAREIYFNPYLLCSGNEVLKDTVKLFDEYEHITPI
ncbi:hypothetical protein ACR77J_07925 [Tissierella praeacuta]|uniref:hypothetical protein n=1 Tax=Tissierella praeacuta TaxID=43131 RepID=UPI003DA57212